MITLGGVNQISRYYGGKAFDPAFLELAQEHFLLWMVREGLFANGAEDVVFKGGTALRKFRLALRGRFSTDLDFAIARAEYAEHVLLSLDEGFEIEGVSFSAPPGAIDWGALKARWVATNDLATSVESKLDFSLRATLLPPEIPTSRAAIPGVARDFLGFDPPLVPLMALPENLAEKLARFRRLIFARDLYDLWKLGPLARDQMDLIRTIVGFKVYFDIIEEGQTGTRPFRGGVEFQARRGDEVVDPHDLGLVMGEPASIPDMLATVQAVFGAMGAPSGAVDERVARIDPTDAYWVRQQYERLREEFRAATAPG